jgi:DNA-binding transcriptional LysR family regulator
MRGQTVLATIGVAGMINSRVEYFLSVWREQSFSRAALRCGVSQPSLTNGIRALEEELGGRLFHRYPHFALTELGKRMLPPLKRMEKAAKEVAAIAAASARSAHSSDAQERVGRERELRLS